VEPVSGGDRRIDRVLEPAFVDGLDALGLDELRRRRDEAELEEADASYLRRLLQGRLDIVRAELARRAEEGAGDHDIAALIDRLPAILTDHDPGSFNAVPRVLAPPRADQHRRRVERLVSDDTLANLHELEHDDLERAVDVLTSEETKVSAVRRRVQDVLDRLRTELTHRYRDGGADVSELLESEAGRRDG
jgi:hypothetical protein